VGGDMQGRLLYRNDAERDKARAMGIADGEKVFGIEDMAKGDVMFAVTGVTNGDFLKGVRFTGDGARTQSVVMRSRTGTVRFIESEHHFLHKPNYGW
jgi:fructose-1,6-bisphosphatase/sedoheptulose 1,7-bisphosphatase-like protein